MITVFITHNLDNPNAEAIADKLINDLSAYNLGIVSDIQKSSTIASLTQDPIRKKADILITYQDDIFGKFVGFDLSVPYNEILKFAIYYIFTQPEFLPGQKINPGLPSDGLLGYGTNFLQGGSFTNVIKIALVLFLITKLIDNE